MQIHHYTSIESLALILKHRTLRFTRADKLDDVKEAQTVAGVDFGRRFFVSSWTGEADEQIPNWNLYGANMRGVRLTLSGSPFAWHHIKEFIGRPASNGSTLGIKLDGVIAPCGLSTILGNGYVLIPDGDMPATFGAQVEYVEDVGTSYRQFVTERPEGVNVAGHGTRPCYLKSRDWAFQKEYRFVLGALLGPSLHYDADPEGYVDALCRMLESTIEDEGGRGLLDATPSVGFIDLPLAEDAFSRLTVTMGPWASESSKQHVVSLLAEHAPFASVRDSSLRGSIRAKA
ncbi:hypothetical protein [Cupriavidus necator]